MKESNKEERRQLEAMRESLLLLHKALIESERAEYEKTFGPVQSAQQMLHLLTSDPWFAWLQSFSQLIVAIDEALDDKKKPVDALVLKNLSGETRGILRPSETGEGFGRQYFEVLQREPAVVLAHAAVLKTLPRLEAKTDTSRKADEV